MPREQVTQTALSDGIGAPLYQRRSASTIGPIELVPNQNFVFPLPSPDSAQSSSSTIASNGARRPMSLQPPSKRGPHSANQRKSVSALPDFSFNPSGSTSASTLFPPLANTPPHSPLPTTPTTPSRPIGHRRGGSEFIGGDGRSGGSGLMSSSPTKGEGVLPPPNSDFKFGPPAGRRGHAHRRSGAISSHDLSSILQPKDPNGVTSSAPVSPMDHDIKPFQGHTANRSLSQPSLRSTSTEENAPFTLSDSTQRRPPSRARVGFSDRVEYIRPLSTISSETESSMSTVRGHSVSNSLSSVISAGAPSPPSSRMARPSLNTTLEGESFQPRPSTAGAVLDVKERGSNMLGDDLDSVTRPMSANAPGSPVSSTSTGSPVTPRTPHRNRWSFRPTSRRSEVGPSIPLPTSSSEPALAVPVDSPIPSPSKAQTIDEALNSADASQANERKSNRKPRKVKSWANAIISLKPKHHTKSKSVAHRSPTAPPARDRKPTLDEPIDLDLMSSLDIDNTVTIVTPPADEQSRPTKATDYTSWKPREFSTPESDSMSPVIDLDAALGPFNTPTIGSASRGSPVRGMRRQLHSGNFNSSTFETGMLNHRRTESAPELVPFEFRNAGMTSLTKMADVFEEEEEEDTNQPTNATTSLLSKASSIQEEEEEEASPSVGIQVVESADVDERSGMHFDFDDGLRIRDSEPEQQLPVEAESQGLPRPHTTLSRSPSSVPTESDPVEVVEDHEEPRISSLTRSSDSTITPTMAAEDVKENPPMMNLSLPLPQQTLMTPDTYNSSSFSSPNFSPSGASFDTPRLGTAASSVTDRGTISSMVLGEPGPEFRVSVDDVPSLTSSRSTMTSGLHNSMPVFMPRSQGGDRSSSVSSIPSIISERRRKRSSIASLSRLMGGSFGEKSKLSIEQRPQSSHDEASREPKPKKAKRLSRLMHFWRPKEPTHH